MKTGFYCDSDDDHQDHQTQRLPATTIRAAAAGDNHYLYRCEACKHEHSPEIHFDEVIFPASCMTLLIVLQLPLANSHGKWVPIFVFDGVPPVFQAFFICLMGACYSSVCSIHIRKVKPKIARFYYAFAVLFMFATFAIAFAATVWEMYKAFPPTLA